MNELTPQSLEQWRAEREAEKRAASIAAFTARYLDATNDTINGTREERIHQGVELGIISEQAAKEMLRRAADAALDAMAEGASGAEEHQRVSDEEFARLVRSAVTALDRSRLVNACQSLGTHGDLRQLARGGLL